MALPFNELTPAEAERLACLSEELGEAVQAIGKILRHGYDSRHPDGGPDNRESLERELGDVRSRIKMMIGAGDLEERRIAAWERDKTRAHAYLHHQDWVKR